MQFLIEKFEDLTVNKIQEIIQKFETSNRIYLNRYKRYYDGNQDILRKQKTDEYKPCNKIITNYCYNIVSNYQGYIAGKDIVYSSADDIGEIQKILNYNDVSYEDSEFLKNALIYGIAFEIMYLDADKMQRFKVVDSRECIPVYDNTLNQELLAVIRYTPIDSMDASKGYSVEVYGSNSVTYYTSSSNYSSLQFVEEQPHYFGQVPVVVFDLNSENKSVFDNVMTLQDAYNTLLSSEVDDFEAFCDAYLVLQGCTADEEDIANMKKNRVLLLDADAKAEYLNKNISDTQIENMLSNINDTIHKIANSPDFSQESFGTSSGIALRYRLLGFENCAGAIVKNMTKALQKRIELICAILNLVGGDEKWRDINIIFTRNIPVDNMDAANMINLLRGLVSDKTLIAQLPFIDDPEQEAKLIEEQNKTNASLYSFGDVQ